MNTTTDIEKKLKRLEELEGRMQRLEEYLKLIEGCEERRYTLNYFAVGVGELEDAMAGEFVCLMKEVRNGEYPEGDLSEKELQPSIEDIFEYHTDYFLYEELWDERPEEYEKKIKELKERREEREKKKIEEEKRRKWEEENADVLYNAKAWRDYDARRRGYKEGVF